MRSLKPIDPDAGEFEGLLLAAHPGLRDPNFRRSVLLLTMHDTLTGAFGFVLNRPLGKSAAELLPEHEQHSILKRVPVYLGGPVGQEQLGFASMKWNADARSLDLETHLSLDDVADRLIKHPERVRAFVGYAGWSAGQLEGELAQKAWVLVNPTEAASKSALKNRLWFSVMNSLGPAYKLMAAIPDDPALN